MHEDLFSPRFPRERVAMLIKELWFVIDLGHVAACLAAGLTLANLETMHHACAVAGMTLEELMELARLADAEGTRS